MSGITLDIDIELVMEWANGLDHPISPEDAHRILKRHSNDLVRLALGAVQDRVEDLILDCDCIEDREDDEAEDAKEDA